MLVPARLGIGPTPPPQPRLTGELPLRNSPDSQANTVGSARCARYLGHHSPRQKPRGAIPVNPAAAQSGSAVAEARFRAGLSPFNPGAAATWRGSPGRAPGFSRIAPAPGSVRSLTGPPRLRVAPGCHASVPSFEWWRWEWEPTHTTGPAWCQAEARKTDRYDYDHHTEPDHHSA